MRARALVFGLVILIGLMSAAPAGANLDSGYAGCDTSGCTVGAGSGGGSGTSSGDSGPTCYFVPLAPGEAPPSSFFDVNGDPTPTDGSGLWYEEDCGGSVQAVYIKNVDPTKLRDEALAHVSWPSPGLNFNPPGEQVVGFSSWLWLDADQWRPVSASVSVPGVSVSVTARPERAVWHMGDGSDVTCAGPGTPYDESRPASEQHTDCSYTYGRSSAGEPGDAYRVSVTIDWHVTWSVTGAAGGGDLGVFSRTTPPVAVRVGEVQAVNTDPGER